MLYMRSFIDISNSMSDQELPDVKLKLMSKRVKNFKM